MLQLNYFYNSKINVHRYDITFYTSCYNHLGNWENVITYLILSVTL